jgi:predicted nucleotidyltransferase
MTIQERIHSELITIGEIMELLKLKEVTSEMGMAQKRQKINDYIEENLLYIDAEIKKLSVEQPKKPWETLNNIFLQALAIGG